MVRFGKVEGFGLDTVAEIGGVIGPAGRDEADAVKRLTDYLTSGLVVCEENQLNEMLFRLYDWEERRSF